MSLDEVLETQRRARATAEPAATPLDRGLPRIFSTSAARPISPRGERQSAQWEPRGSGGRLSDVAWFRRDRSYDRNGILARARRAAARGAHVKAIALYERVREAEPNNPDVLRRLGIQRARAGQRAEAWRDCGAAAEVVAKRGFVEQAIGIYREFATHVPDEPSVWHALAELELERKRPPDAVDALLKGRRHFRSKRKRTEALSLLRRARRIDPTHFEANFDLAGLLIRDGVPGPARRMLESLAPHARTRRDRRRLRGRLFRLSPTPAAAWRWLAALFGGS